MRLKEDSSSLRARAIKKRDFKHDHSERRAIFRLSKDTHKWCRGKMGISHLVNWHDETDFFGDKYQSGKCSSCGKLMFRCVRQEP